MYLTRITRSLEENPGARDVRAAVFMEEQGYQNEFDDHDAGAVHLCIYDGETGIATARCYPKGDGVWVMGRVAVRRDYRGQRLGSRAVREMEDYLKTALGAREIELSAQLHAMKMYEALVYQAEGGLIYDEGQPHRMMRRSL